MLQKYLFLFLAFLLIISCDPNDPENSTPVNRLLELAYDNSYQYPEGFYHESNLNTSVYYENTVSIKPMNEREHIWIELNTDAREQARTWSNLSNDYSSVTREIVDETETEKYFEFVRVNPQNSNGNLLSRVHRSSYFIPHHDKFTSINTVGVYNGELAIDKAKELIEYLWDCGSLGLYEKVVVSKITESENKLEQYIQSLNVVYGDFGIKDIIYVYDNYFQLDTSTRVLSLRRELVNEIEGVRN